MRSPWLCGKIFLMRKDFIKAIRKYQPVFNLTLSETNILALTEYDELVQKHNEILHLVAPCSPEEFAVRHVLESLTVLAFLPENSSFADVGTGAGLPAIPCLIVRDDLRGVLIESKLKKADFLQEALTKCNLDTRAEIINRQFEEVQKPDTSYILCRALDKFTKKLPKLLKWSAASDLLLFGGNALRDELRKNGVNFTENLLPMSEQRYLFIIKNS